MCVRWKWCGIGAELLCTKYMYWCDLMPITKSVSEPAAAALLAVVNEVSNAVIKILTMLCDKGFFRSVVWTLHCVKWFASTSYMPRKTSANPSQ